MHAFRSCGLDRGDIVLVQSDLAAVGPVASGSESIPGLYLAALQDVVGPLGTIAVQAAFLDYGRWEAPYDVKLSPVSRSLGVFARYVASRPETVRSVNAIAALAAVGPQAEYLCRGGTGSAFGVDSPWDRLYQGDGKMLFLGIDLRFMTFVHYVEHMVGVPHIYNKYYPIPVFEDRKPLQVQVTAQVRYLDFGIEYETEHLTAEFETAGLVSTVDVGRSRAWCVRATDAFAYVKQRLQRDCFYLLKRPPAFVKGRIPTDGGTADLHLDESR